MAGRLRLAGPGAAWLALAALFAAGALAGWTQPAARWDWQPGLAASQPWRCWSAAFVHWSPLHLAANGLGLAVVAAFGPVARLAPRCALAWFVAWPLTQLGLLTEPALLHYGGLSGVLHAGVAVAAVEMVAGERGRRRGIACAVLAGLLLKVALEAPWGPPLRYPADWDIPIAPLVHASGAFWGFVCGALAAWLPRRRGG